MQNENTITSEDFSQLASEVDNSKLVALGFFSQLSAKGEYSKLMAAGKYSSLVAEGRYSVAISSGRGSRVKGAEGTLIALTHYKYDDKGDEFMLYGKMIKGNKYTPRKIVTGKIGEEGLLPDTWYTLNEKGEFVECND